MNEDSGDSAEEAASRERDGSDTDGGVHDRQDVESDAASESETETDDAVAGGPGDASGEASESGTADETTERAGSESGDAEQDTDEGMADDDRDADTAVEVDGQRLSSLLIALDEGVADHTFVDDSVGQALVDDVVELDSVGVDETFRRHLEGASTETVTGALAVLGDALVASGEELADEREQVADLESRLRRKQAEFQNYKKRQEERMEEEKERATEDLVERLLDVRDNLQRALDQDEDADIRGGVESTLDQFDRELDRENVEAIEPEPGDRVDPGRHEVLATVTSEQPEDAIAGVHRAGYEMAGKVLRPAQVTVSEGADESDGDAGESETEADSPATE